MCSDPESQLSCSAQAYRMGGRAEGDPIKTATSPQVSRPQSRLARPATRRAAPESSITVHDAEYGTFTAVQKVDDEQRTLDHMDQTCDLAEARGDIST
jgi:hypothetical protein